MPRKKSPLPQMGFLIYDVGRLLRSNWGERADGVGMTEAQWRTIAHLTRMEGCRQTDLAQTLQIRPITLARVIDRLEAAGLVERKRHATDRRALTLHLTERAAPFIERLGRRGEELNRQALKGIPAAEQAQLLQLLERIRDNLAGCRHGRPPSARAGVGQDD